jgi:hypothetical protein
MSDIPSLLQLIVIVGGLTLVTNAVVGAVLWLVYSHRLLARATNICPTCTAGGASGFIDHDGACR